MAFSLQTARDKALVKQAILKQLATLPRVAQEDVLADIVLTYEDTDTTRAASPEPDATANGASRSNPAMQTTWRLKMKKKRGRPLQRGNGKTAAVEATLKAHPGMSIADLAKVVYPDETDAEHRIRAILWSLKKQGRARNVETGKWEVTPKPAT
jgi:hypothetical protein